MSEQELEGEPIPAFDPANVMFGETQVGATLQLADTAGGPVFFIGFRTSNCTFTVPFDTSAELEGFIDALKQVLPKFKEREVRSQFSLPGGTPENPLGGLLLPSHMVPQGPTSPIRRNG